jgi:hypothetical protein
MALQKETAFPGFQTSVHSFEGMVVSLSLIHGQTVTFGSAKNSDDARRLRAVKEIWWLL